MYSMKVISKALVLLLGFTTSLAFAQEVASNKTSNVSTASVYKAKAKKLDRAEIDALLAKPDQILLIDVRRPDELTAIGGFPIYLSIQFEDLENNTAFIPKDRTIVTLSNHAGRAGAAADLLTNKGFKVAGAVGVQNYEEQGGKLTKIKPSSPKVIQ